MSTKDELAVMWLGEEGHDEVFGVYVYAYFPDSCPPVSEDVLSKVGITKFAQSKSSIISVDDGEVMTTTIKVDTWPNDDEWAACLDGFCSALIELGAKVVWIGGEDCSWTLDTLDPELSDGNIYAGYSAKTGLVFNSQLSEELAFLSDEQMMTLGECVDSS